MYKYKAIIEEEMPVYVCNIVEVDNIPEDVLDNYDNIKGLHFWDGDNYQVKLPDMYIIKWYDGNCYFTSPVKITVDEGEISVFDKN